MWDGDLTGEVVDGRYALGTLYGSGGMAEVYRALDTRADRRVAIKFFLGAEAGEDRIRLDREAEVLAALRCPGLVEVYGTGVFRGRPFYVMQAVDGGTLRRRMRGAMAPEAVAAIGAQVAGVLAHVHANDVVHRDVKPSNILLDTAGRRAYLADFGLALQGQVTRVTRSGILVGTAGYLAPEQVRGADVRPSADVYALGLVLLECLTGRPEYPGGDTEAALARLHREPRVPVDLPAPWAEVLTAMTASNPDGRPSAAECERLLERARQASAGLAPLVGAAVADRSEEPRHALKAGRGRADGGAADVGGTGVGGAGGRGLRPDSRAALAGAVVAAGALTLVGFLLWGDTYEPTPGERSERTVTSTVGDPVAEQVKDTGAVVPGDPAGATSTAVDAVPAERSPDGADDAGGPSTTTTTTTSTGTTEAPTTTDKTVRQPPVEVPTNAPVVIAPNSGQQPTRTGPPSKTRGSENGRG
ncbi:serine/threonine-protein kinase [Saccharothrix sp. HUAS TT1]|uniref:serine/threonine-protein kinase n=1 Tax=unclassified Saccharothrix TaxID=2593673 RepID=UPI00345BD05B